MTHSYKMIVGSSKGKSGNIREETNQISLKGLNVALFFSIFVGSTLHGNYVPVSFMFSLLLQCFHLP